VNPAEIELHPEVHNVSKAHELRVMVRQAEYDQIQNMNHRSDMPYDSISHIVREAIVTYCDAILKSEELPVDLKDAVLRRRAMDRWLKVQAAREGLQKLLRLARDELVMLVSREDGSGMAKAYKYVENTFTDLAAMGEESALDAFNALPVVRYVRQWKEGVAEGQEMLSFDMAKFKSEIGIP